jgi:hypothetical protein
MDAILFWNRFEGRGLRGTSLSRATGQFAVVETALAEVLTSTTSLPETAQAAARAKAGERYDEFLNALGRRLAAATGDQRGT